MTTNASAMRKIAFARKDTALPSGKKFGRRIAFVAAAVTALIGFTSTAAYAGGEVFHGSDNAWTIGLQPKTLFVSDHECDNHGVYAEATWDDGLSYMSVHDLDGCGGNYYFTNVFNNHGIQLIRVCERSVGCSAWKNVWGVG